jgi:hypothetical protein
MRLAGLETPNFVGPLSMTKILQPTPSRHPEEPAEQASRGTRGPVGGAPYSAADAAGRAART